MCREFLLFDERIGYIHVNKRNESTRGIVVEIVML